MTGGGELDRGGEEAGGGGSPVGKRRGGGGGAPDTLPGIGANIPGFHSLLKTRDSGLRLEILI